MLSTVIASILAATILLIPPPLFDEDVDRSIPVAAPSALHAGSYDSQLGVRVGRDGTIDGGSGILTLIDGVTGEVLNAENLRYDRGKGKHPTFTPTWTAHLEDLILSVRIVGATTGASGDSRLNTSIRLVIDNPTDEEQVLELGARLIPGGDGDKRPHPSVPFSVGTTFKQEGNVVTRDGLVCFAWTEPETGVVVHPHPEASDDVAVELKWDFSVRPMSARAFTLSLAGPPAADVVAEEDFRERFLKWGFPQLEERLGWQLEWRGYLEEVSLGSRRAWRSLVSSLHVLRQLGVGYNSVRVPTPHPYGHPAEDLGIEAQMLGAFFEWDLGAYALPYTRWLLEQAMERGQTLDADERLAFAHGLTRAVRVSTNMPELALQLAPVISTLVDEPATVPFYMDPEVVRADLADTLRRAGIDGAEFPPLSWASTAEGSLEESFQNWRRAISDRDSEAVWAAMVECLSATDEFGIGSLDPAGEPEGLFSLAYLSLMREMFLDDHDATAKMLPCVPLELIPDREWLDTLEMPATFGRARIKIWWHTPQKTKVRVQFHLKPVDDPGPIVHCLPRGLVADRLRQMENGTAHLTEDGRFVVLEPDVRRPQGLGYLVVPVGERAAGDAKDSEGEGDGGG